MKKGLIVSLIALSGLTALPAMAAVDFNTYRFECPNASGGAPSERLTNYGSYIRGNGESNTGLNKVLASFTGVPDAGVPLNLAAGAYTHAGTQYNPHSGRITCLFVSGNGSAPFNVSYRAQNTKGGFVQKSDNSAITVRVWAG